MGIYLGQGGVVRKSTGITFGRSSVHSGVVFVGHSGVVRPVFPDVSNIASILFDIESVSYGTVDDAGNITSAVWNAVGSDAWNELVKLGTSATGIHSNYMQVVCNERYRFARFGGAVYAVLKSGVKIPLWLLANSITSGSITLTLWYNSSSSTSNIGFYEFTCFGVSQEGFWNYSTNRTQNVNLKISTNSRFYMGMTVYRANTTYTGRITPSNAIINGTNIPITFSNSVF